MAQLKITNPLWRAMLNFGTPVTNINYVTYNVVSPAAIYIMSGVMPSPSAVNTMTTASITNTTTGYGNNILMTFTGGQNFVCTDNTVTLGDSGTVAATGSGIATWVVVSLGGNRVLVGDVTDAYGAGFLLINDINISTGDRYKILSMQFSMNNEYTI